MKRIFPPALVLVLGATLLHAQSTQPTTPPSAEPGAAAAAESEEEEPVKLEPDDMSEWTNSVGLVLVKVSDGLWAGKYEVTQEEYSEVTGGNPSSFKGDRRPVDSVSWNAAVSFCEKLTKLERESELLPENYGYALPTEKQWETLVGGATLADAVTSEERSRSATAEVGGKGANSLGLHDTRGNVMEWVLDGFNPDYNYRILRGASWKTKFEVNLRTNFRHYAPPSDAKDEYGFRVVLVKGIEDRAREESGAQQEIRY